MPLPWQVFLTHCIWCCPADLAVLVAGAVVVLVVVVLAQRCAGATWRADNKSGGKNHANPDATNRGDGDKFCQPD